MYLAGILVGLYRFILTPKSKIETSLLSFPLTPTQLLSVFLFSSTYTTSFYLFLVIFMRPRTFFTLLKFVSSAPKMALADSRPLIRVGRMNEK